MTASMRSYLASLGTDLTLQMADATQRAFAERVAPLSPDIAVSRDQAYGPDPRNLLDIFTPQSPPAAKAPVLVFVHGGGFVMGDRRLPNGLPFYDNVGAFAVRSGFIGVTMTYRLAPGSRWPAGAEDVARATGWLRENVAAHGGDPARIFLLGQSAGAVHVAGAVTDARFQLTEGPQRVAGALLISGIYDMGQASNSPLHVAYYGEDQSKWAAASTLEGLATSPLPLLFSVCELDSAEFQKQAARMVSASYSARGRFPRMHWLPGHNHISPILALGLGAPLDALGPLIQEFIAGIDA